MYLFKHEANEFEKIEYLEKGVIKPMRRNSHSCVQVGNKAYIYGGANDEGLLNDGFELDLVSKKFSNMKLDKTKAPSFEMHTAHLFQGNKLLLIGGRTTKVNDEG